MILLRNCRRRRKQRSVIERLASGLLLPKLWLPMSPGYPCCCGENCFYEQDNFSRSDSSDLGSKWSEVAGSWSISSNVITTASSNAVCTCTTDADELSYVVLVSVRLSHANDVARVLFNYTNPATFAYVEIKSTGFGGGTINAYDSAGLLLGTGNIVIGIGKWHGVKICVHSGVVQVHFDGAVEIAAVTTNTQMTVGLGTGLVTTGVSFDDFSLQRHVSTKVGCPECSGLCTTNCIDGLTTDRIKVVIAGMANGGAETDPNCPNFNGTWILHQDLNPCVYKSGDQPWEIDDVCSPFSDVSLRFEGTGMFGDCVDDISHNHAVKVSCGYGTSGICVWAGCTATFRHTQVDKYDCDDLINLNIPRHASADYCDRSTATCVATAL